MNETVADGRMPLRLLGVVLFCLLTLFAGVAAAAEPKVVVNVGQSGDAFIIDALIDVQVPSGTAWDVLTDFDHLASIIGNLTSSRITSRSGNTWIVLQEGAVRFGPLSFPFVSEREMRLEPTNRILARNLSGSLKSMESETTIVDQDQGVQIKYHARSVPESLLARLFGASFVRRGVEDQFVAMAREMVRRHAGVGATAIPDEAPAH